MQNKHTDNTRKDTKSKTTKSTECSQNPNLNSDLIKSIKGKITSRKTPDVTTQSLDQQNPYSKNRATHPQNHSNPNVNKNQGNTYIIMDSNRIFTNFKELLAEENLNGSITIIPGGNLNSAESILKFPKIFNPSKILLHIVVNDIDEQHSQDLAFNLKNLSEKSHRKFSSILIRRSPRGDYYEGHVHPVNQEITYQLRNTQIKGITKTPTQ